MKKVLLIAVLAIAGLANAQEIKSSKGEAYLPESGDWAISFNGDGLFRYVGNSFNGATATNNAPSVTYARNNSFVGKKFISATNAYRVVANFAIASNSTTNPSGANTVENKNSGFDLAAGLGKEWRRGKTRLQGFYGADALLTMSSVSNTQTFTNTNTGAFVSSTDFKGGFGLGLAAQGFIGAEYFIFPKFSVGAQYTYRVGFDMVGESETTFQPAVGSAVTTKGGKNTNFGIGGVGVSTINITLHF
jgi:hypothetical protein